MTQEKPDSGTAPNSNDVPDVSSVTSYLKQLQIQCCKQFQALDTDKSFIEDSWQHDSGGGGITRVIENGRVFEKGGVNFSHIVGKSLPQAAALRGPLLRANLLKLPVCPLLCTLLIHLFRPVT